MLCMASLMTFDWKMLLSSKCIYRPKHTKNKVEFSLHYEIKTTTTTGVAKICQIDTDSKIAHPANTISLQISNE